MRKVQLKRSTQNGSNSCLKINRTANEDGVRFSLNYKLGRLERCCWRHAVRRASTGGSDPASALTCHHHRSRHSDDGTAQGWRSILLRLASKGLKGLIGASPFCAHFSPFLSLSGFVVSWWHGPSQFSHSVSRHDAWLPFLQWFVDRRPWQRESFHCELGSKLVLFPFLCRNGDSEDSCAWQRRALECFADKLGSMTCTTDSSRPVNACSCRTPLLTYSSYILNTVS